LNKLFFENNRVITSAYDCEKREKLNKIMLNNYQQNNIDDALKDEEKSDAPPIALKSTFCSIK